jgi:hypothetical protein
MYPSVQTFIIIHFKPHYFILRNIHIMYVIYFTSDIVKSRDLPSILQLYPLYYFLLFYAWDWPDGGYKRVALTCS